MLRHVGRAVALAVAFASIATAQRSTTEPLLVLAELFTSEGCSSCPPADHLLETLLKEQPISGVYVVPLSEHVTYWDHQGWKDPFGSEQFTNRQKAYGSGFNLDSIYTPQLVIDGVTEAVGSDERTIRKLLLNAAKTPKPRLIVEASLKPDGTVTASVSGAGMAVSASDAELWWAITEDNLVVDVRRGENASRTLRHSGVVRRLSADTAFKPGGPAALMMLHYPSTLKRENLRVVAFLQSKNTRRVLSVGFAQVF